jgi:DNA mismatch repair ATPase MutS
MLQNDNENELLSDEEKKVLNTISKKSLFLSVNIDVSNEFSAILFYVVEIIKGIFLADAIQYNRIISLINKNSKLLLRAYRFVGRVDSAISVASLKTGYTNYVEPLFIPGNKITALDVYHPLIKDCKSNSIITNGSNVTITGGNMSGKTTFLKTIGVNVILAQTINFTFSSKFELPPLKLFSSIQNRDKLTEGISFFMDELLRTKQILKSIASSQDMHFILIDEIYRGTNSKDRITLASSVLNYLAKSHCMIFVTTHDLDIIDFVSDYYEQFYFDNRFVNNRVVFDYKIHQGVQKKTNVVELIKSLNFPKEIISSTIDYGSTFGSSHHFVDNSNTKEIIRK